MHHLLKNDEETLDDKIPHRDYPPRSNQKNRSINKDQTVMLDY